VTLTELGDEQFLSLTTFRRSGEPVATTVWVARDADALVVTTIDGSGKVKRLRNDPKVELRPSGRRGEVAADAPIGTGVAEILADGPGVQHGHEIIRRKYGFQYRLITGVEWLMTRGKGRGRRVILRITES
jgi:uncharacterized protein